MLNKTIKTATIGMLAALTFVATIVIHIPMPSTQGYVNIGDTIIFVSAALLGGVPAMIAGALGSALADLIYAPEWTLFTILIKGLEGLICGLIIKGLGKLPDYISKLLAMISSALWMVGGYYLAGAALYGWAGSFASLPGNLFQGGVCVAIAYPLWLLLSRIKALNAIIIKIKG